jgi:hypothetical protein
MVQCDSIRSCTFCEKKLVGGDKSKEHVIPNSIGGRLKTSGFICLECNVTRGDRWDSELAEQLNWFSLALGISRERGAPPGQLVNTVDGRQLTLLPDGSFLPGSSYREEEVDGQKRISIVARSVAEAEKRIEGVSRKYPLFDKARALSELEVKTDYLDSPLALEMSIGGAKAGRSLVKTALAFASHCGVPHEEFGGALHYLSNQQAEPPFGHAYLSDLVLNREQHPIFHCVSLKSDGGKSRLWAYIEYYGLFRVIVLINDHYAGPVVDKTYALDPITGEQLNVEVRADVPEDEFWRVVSGDGWDSDIHSAAADFALPRVIKRSEQRALESAVASGFAHAVKTLGIPEGADIPKEKAAEFTALLMEKLGPYISHRVRAGRHNT